MKASRVCLIVIVVQPYIVIGGLSVLLEPGVVPSGGGGRRLCGCGGGGGGGCGGGGW